jgi:enoyl reductase-like protein
MRRFLLAILSAALLPGVMAAQAITGEKAEAVKKEIMKIEDEKVAGLLRGGSEPVDWIKQYDAEEVAQTNIDGSSPSKSEIEEAGWAPIPRV